MAICIKYQKDNYLDIFSLPDSTLLTLSDLETSKVKGKKGILPISASQIRRFELKDKFPKAIKIPGMRGRFYLAGDIKEWIRQNFVSESDVNIRLTGRLTGRFDGFINHEQGI